MKSDIIIPCFSLLSSRLRLRAPVCTYPPLLHVHSFSQGVSARHGNHSVGPYRIYIHSQHSFTRNPGVAFSLRCVPQIKYISPVDRSVSLLCCSYVSISSLSAAPLFFFNSMLSDSTQIICLHVNILGCAESFDPKMRNLECIAANDERGGMLHQRVWLRTRARSRNFVSSSSTCLSLHHHRVCPRRLY